VELHHVVPFAMGGAHSAENLRVYCRVHNQRQGERDFGPREEVTLSGKKSHANRKR
jgi:5-methylcytosine-specific restriction endonuclease McrA